MSAAIDLFIPLLPLIHINHLAYVSDLALAVAGNAIDFIAFLGCPDEHLPLVLALHLDFHNSRLAHSGQCRC